MDQFRALVDRFEHLKAHHDGVNDGSWVSLLASLQHVVTECVARAAERGEDEELPEDLPEIGIPKGFERCCGPCKRILQLSSDHPFHLLVTVVRVKWMRRP